MHGTDQSELSSDIRVGAASIAELFFGDRRMRRKVYHLLATSNCPHFKLGSQLAVRVSAVLEWIAAQEQRHLSKKHNGT